MHQTLHIMHVLSLHHGVTCGICMEPVSCVYTSCALQCCKGANMIHTQCLLQWYVKQREQNQDMTCPFCRATMLSVAEFDSVYTFIKTAQATGEKKTVSETFNPPPVYSDANFVHSSDDASLGTHTHLANMHLMQLTSVAYIFFFINLFFVMAVLARRLFE